MIALSCGTGEAGSLWAVLNQSLMPSKIMKAAPINHGSGPSLFFGSKENRGAEEPLETVDESAVVRAVFGEIEEVEHLGGRIEMDLAGFLPQRERGNPDGNEPILAERQTEIGIGNDMERKFAVAPTMDDLEGRRTAQREPA